MLEKAKFICFQRHRKVIIKFDKVTCLVGPTDAGKSAILRGLRWLCLNQPSGADFITHGRKNSIVKVWIDGQTITRKRGRTNSYSLQGKIFRAFGSLVPPEIAALLNVRETNFQDQHDPPFWFSLTPGQVSRELNSIVNLEVIDETLAEANSQLRRSRTEVELCEERLNKSLEEQKKLKFVKGLNRELQELEKFEQELCQLSDRAESLSSVIGEAERLIQTQESALLLKREGDRLLSLAEDTLQAEGKVNNLQPLLEHLEEQQTLLQTTIPDLTPLSILAEELEETQQEVNSLSSLLQQIQETKEHLCQVKNEAGDAENELRKETKGRCPVCGTPMK